MEKTYEEFELEVKCLCSPADFKKNGEKLKKLRFSSHQAFKNLLMLGGNITNSIKAAEEIFKISKKTYMTENEIVMYLNNFKLINSFIDNNSKD